MIITHHCHTPYNMSFVMLQFPAPPRPDDVMEASIVDCAPTREIPDETGVTFKVVEGATRKTKGGKLFDNLGYAYIVKRQNKSEYLYTNVCNNEK